MLSKGDVQICFVEDIYFSRRAVRLYPSLKEKKYKAPVFRIKYLGSVFFDRNRFARAAKDYLKINKNDKNKIKRILDTVGL